MLTYISPEAARVLTLGCEKYWGFRVAEGSGTLSEETYLNGWWYLPTDSMQITRASKRIDTIKKSGVRISQVIIAHEAPKLLCAPKKTGEVNTPPKGPSKAVGGLVWGLVGILAVGITAMAVVTLAYVLLYLLLPVVMGVMFFLMLGLGVLVDPCAIIVLEDGTRIEVMRWIE